MDSIFDIIILDNTIWKYTVVALIILGTIVLKKFFSRPLVATVIWLLQLMGRRVDRKAFIDLILHPLEDFLMVFTWFIAFTTLNFPKALQLGFYHTDTKVIIERIAATIVIIYFFRLLIRMIDYLAYVISNNSEEDQGGGRRQLVIFFKDFLKAIVSIAGIFVIIKFAFRYQISELLTGLGIVGAALALSARESLENLIASFIIFFDKPFVVGDSIKVQQVTGTVERIGLRSTRLRTTEKTVVSVPNKQMVDSILDNLTLRIQRRADLKLELATSTSGQQLESFLKGVDALLLHPKIEHKVVFLSDIVQHGGYLIHIEYYTAPIPVEDFNALKQEINLATILLLNKEGIQLVVPAKEPAADKK